MKDARFVGLDIHKERILDRGGGLWCKVAFSRQTPSNRYRKINGLRAPIFLIYVLCTRALKTMAEAVSTWAEWITSWAGR